MDFSSLPLLAFQKKREEARTPGFNSEDKATCGAEDIRAHLTLRLPFASFENLLLLSPGS